MSQKTRQAQAAPLGASSARGGGAVGPLVFKSGFVRLRLNSFCKLQQARCPHPPTAGYGLHSSARQNVSQ